VVSCLRVVAWSNTSLRIAGRWSFGWNQTLCRIESEKYPRRGILWLLGESAVGRSTDFCPVVFKLERTRRLWKGRYLNCENIPYWSIKRSTCQCIRFSSSSQGICQSSIDDGDNAPMIWNRNLLKRWLIIPYVCNHSRRMQIRGHLRLLVKCFSVSCQEFIYLEIHISSSWCDADLLLCNPALGKHRDEYRKPVPPEFLLANFPSRLHFRILLPHCSYFAAESPSISFIFRV
jgi:hypothetical protein